MDLPPFLKDELAAHERACISIPAMVNGIPEIVLLARLPDEEIRECRSCRVWYRYELYLRPTAPVLRVSLRLFDRPDAPLQMETYFNVDEADQLADVRTLAWQEQIRILFLGAELRCHFAKVLPQSQRMRSELKRLIQQALTCWAQITPEKPLSQEERIARFMQAKEEVMGLVW